MLSTHNVRAELQFSDLCNPMIKHSAGYGKAGPTHEPLASVQGTQKRTQECRTYIHTYVRACVQMYVYAVHPMLAACSTSCAVTETATAYCVPPAPLRLLSQAASGSITCRPHTGAHLCVRLDHLDVKAALGPQPQIAALPNLGLPTGRTSHPDTALLLCVLLWGVHVDECLCQVWQRAV